MMFRNLYKLTTTNGTSGDEYNVAKIIIDIVEKIGLVHQTDKLGNVTVYKPTSHSPESAKTIMLCAHMDEVGFIITDITAGGYLKFQPVGGIDARILPAKRVTVGKAQIHGTITSKAHHLSKNAHTAPDYDVLAIDIGARNREDAEKSVSKGDYAYFLSDFTEFGGISHDVGKAPMLKAKALDDRVSCGIMLELMEEDYPVNVYFAFTVQEESGCRGAKVITHGKNIDNCIVLEGTTCADFIDIQKGGFSTILGDGVAISILDSGSYSNKELVQVLTDTATRNNIKFQYKRTTKGGNDASAIHIAKNGIKTAVLSVPCRYIHSPSSICAKSDIYSCLELTKAFLMRELS